MATLTLDPSQLRAVDLVRQGRDLLITGGAGTGKTTVIATIITALRRECELLAPTGKAAARLREVTGFPASTIHSWLRFDGESYNRAGRAKLPLIVDEASMIDSELLARLQSFGPPQIILVGDAAQLPPVGRGQPFHDLLVLRPDMAITLTVNHRQGAAIHEAATLIRQGQLPPAKLVGGGETWAAQETGGGADTEKVLRAWLDAKHLDFSKDIILTGNNGETEEDYGSVLTLNKLIASIVNPRGPDEAWRVGDRVMNTKNANEDDWYNGDSGTVTGIDTSGNLWVSVDRPREQGAEILLTAAHRKHLKLAYAVTIHKSQGSQYRNVVLVMLKRQQELLSRALVYTAVTRARKQVIVVGQMAALANALSNQEHKATVLQRLAGIAPKVA